MPAVRRSEGALALIQHAVAGTRRYLTRWNRHWECYALVGGHRQRSESFRDCLVREIFEELALHEGRDLRVAAQPLSHLAYRAWSARAQAETDYVLEVFAVEFVGETVPAALAERAGVRWITREEIRAGKCTDGAPVSETVERVVARLEHDGIV